MKPDKIVIYRGFEIKLNPLSQDWFVDIGSEYGAYFGTLAGMKSIVNTYLKVSESGVTLTEAKKGK